MKMMSLKLSGFESAMLLAQESILLLREIAEEQEPNGGPLSEKVQQSADKYDELRVARREMKVELANMESELSNELSNGVEVLMDFAATKTVELLEFQE